MVVAKRTSAATPGSLAELAPGQTARIDRVEGFDDPVGQRLSHLGFLPGTKVTTVRRAPMGDPTIFELRGNQMCLRIAESNRVLLVVDAPDSP